jgi:Ni/Co efflux regulator RcnB
MNRKGRTFAAALAAMVLALGAARASARPRSDHGHPRHERDDRGHAHRDHRADAHWHGAHPRWGGPPHAHGHRHYRRERRHRVGQHDRRDAAAWHRPHRHAHVRGAGPRHDLHVGRVVPAYYRPPHYVVRDWHVHRPAAPTRGHRWVQAGADHLLVAIGTGPIAQVVLVW